VRDDSKSFPSVYFFLKFHNTVIGHRQSVIANDLPTNDFLI